MNKEDAVSNMVKESVEEMEKHRRTLEINPPALERLIAHTTDYLSLLIYEADRIARRRWGDSIQSGDVDLANRTLEGRSKGYYWSVAIGCALAGAGVQGLADSILSHKGTTFIVVYSIAILVGIIILYLGAPRR